MSNVLNWIKSNVVIVVCLLVMLAAMGSLLWPTGSAGAKFQSELNQRPQQLSKITGAIRRPVSIPPQDPNAPPTQAQITVSDAAVQELGRINRRMNSSYDQLYQHALAFNQSGPNGGNPHKPMIDGLFGVANPPDSLVFSASSAYVRALRALYDQKALAAGVPPTTEQINSRTERAKATFLAAYLGNPANAATDPGMARKQADELRKLLLERAASIGLYMQPPLSGASAAGSAPTGFQVTTLASMTERPDMALLWESQMQLWIQQDLLYAVALANHLDGPASVTQNPVKRVLSMTVKPGYIGASTAATTPGLPAQPVVEDLNQRLPDNFLTCPTGRHSNSLYDVRMATLSVLIDAKRIPELLNAIGQTNFMTPIIDKISSVDQVDLLAHGGYVFGDKVDVVQLDLTVETLWLRRWTAGQTDDGAIEEFKLAHPNDPTFANQSHDEQVKYLKQNGLYDLGLMPDVVRAELGMAPRDPNYKPAGFNTTNTPGGGMYPGAPGSPGLPGGRMYPGAAGQSPE